MVILWQMKMIKYWSNFTSPVPWGKEILSLKDTCNWVHGSTFWWKQTWEWLFQLHLDQMIYRFRNNFTNTFLHAISRPFLRRTIIYIGLILKPTEVILIMGDLNNQSFLKAAVKIRSHLQERMENWDHQMYFLCWLKEGQVIFSFLG